MKEKNIQVLKVEPQKIPEQMTLKNELPALQEAVRGLIEIIPLSEKVCLLCNEESKLLGLEGNRRLGDDIIAGIFYIIGSDDEGNLCSLTKADQVAYAEQFREPEIIEMEEVQDSMHFALILF